MVKHALNKLLCHKFLALEDLDLNKEQFKIFFANFSSFKICSDIKVLMFLYIFGSQYINVLLFPVAWGYHRQGFCQAGFSTVVSKVIFYWLLLLLL